MNLWDLQHVSLGPAGQPRLDDVTVEIPSGVTAILGESGAGKTSLLNLLVEFEKPTSGHVHHVPHMVSWVPADFALWPTMTVAEHLFESQDDWLARFDLTHLSDQFVETLSMGERSRLAVARALSFGQSQDDMVYVMDEPLVHVDSHRQSKYWNIIRDVVAAQNASFIFASHAPDVVIREAEHVICMESGKVVWQGKVNDLYESPPDQNVARFLGPTNWITESQTWFSGSEISQTNVRPERLSFEENTESSLIIEESHFAGHVANTVVRNESTNQTQEFWHRPQQKIESGTRVDLNILMAFMLMLLPAMQSGCNTSSGQEPELHISKIKHHSLPVEGAMLPAPRGMTFSPDGELFVLDNAGRIIVYNKAGEFTRSWWMPEYEDGKPEGCWVLLDGRIAVADTHYNRVVFFTQQGEFLGSFGEKGQGPGQFIYVIAVTQDPNGFLYVAENGGNDRVQKFDKDGNYVLSIGACGIEPGEFQRPSGIAWYEDHLYVADAINNRIQVFKDDGTFVKILADAETTGLHYPYDLAQAPDGSLFVPEYGAGRISQISLEGKLLARYGHEGRGLGQFWTPWGIAVSDDGKVAVADTGNRRMVEIEL